MKKRIHTLAMLEIVIPTFYKKQTSKSGYESEVTVCECEDCIGCPYKEKCTKSKGSKRLYISKSFLEKRQEFYENIQSETGIKYRMNCSVQVEGEYAKRTHKKLSFPSKGNRLNNLKNEGLFKVRQKSRRISKRKEFSPDFSIHGARVSRDHLI